MNSLPSISHRLFVAAVAVSSDTLEPPAPEELPLDDLADKTVPLEVLARDDTAQVEAARPVVSALGEW